MKNSGHWRLAIGQIKQYPLLLILTIPIIALAIIIWVKMDFVFSVFDVPKMLLPAYIVTVKALGVIFPVLLLWGLVDVIGTLNA